ncbi:hypothetical protein EIN_315660 [Entamoeba invadens IP1]|uniref:Uncharacterized protein n=1 Tax=Entamoeba invadens IP1 TaxID=370355 RepID=A0A0A1TZC7_ENTIV|nr:hypothetical protein EIN_315660 [Entamoeba invadens IP1]ELP86937.1 hypothetical protein EIN_315660 [Entamoeba invadens IP1]|eukprot:XP_004253708.1 hypothetical protein EIN_315660 [Entamoeba invadens IP1]
MTRLEECFLANVVLYMDSTLTAHVFSTINKKCLDAIKILKINPSYPVNTNTKQQDTFIQKECNFDLQQSFMREIRLFSNIETISFSTQTLQFLPLVPDTIKCFHLPLVSKCQVQKVLEQKEKIVAVSFKAMKTPIDFSTFNRLSRITFIITSPQKVSDFLTSYNQRFDFVYIRMEGFIDWEFLEHHSRYNIEKTVLEFDKKSLLEEVLRDKRLLLDVTICYRKCYKGMDPTVIVHTKDELNEYFNISKKGFNEQLVERYYPSNVKITGFCREHRILDFTNLRSVSSIKSLGSSLEIRPPALLTALDSKLNVSDVPLKELHLQGRNTQENVFPDTLTALTICDFKEVKNYTQLIRLCVCGNKTFPADECYNLTFLSLSCPSPPPLNKLEKLKVLCFDRKLVDVDINTMYPTSLESLQCYSGDIPKELGVTKLFLNDSLKNNEIEKYSKLKKLRFLGTNGDNKKLPSNLTSLTISCFGASTQKMSLKYIECAHVKELHIENCLVHSIELPNQLDTLYLHYCSFAISGEVCVKKLALNESIISNIEMISKRTLKNIYSRKSKISEFVQVELYDKFPLIELDKKVHPKVHKVSA